LHGGAGFSTAQRLFCPCPVKPVRRREGVQIVSVLLLLHAELTQRALLNAFDPDFPLGQMWSISAPESPKSVSFWYLSSLSSEFTQFVL
jgi:hypothetical protein